MFGVCLVLLLCCWTAAPGVCTDVILRPSSGASTSLEAIFLLLPAPQLPPSSYLPLAKATQLSSSGGSISVWVGIPDLGGVPPAQLNLSEVVERVRGEMRARGLNASKDVPLFLGAHSQELARPLQDHASSSSNGVAGLVLLGAFVTRKYQSLPSLLTPTLTVAGELDGVCRITRIMEDYVHRIRAARDPKVAGTNSPMAVVRGMTHMQFASGEPSDTIKKYDLKPEVDNDTAHLLVSRLVASFIEARYGPRGAPSTVRASAYLASALRNTSNFFQPLVEAYSQEGSYYFKPPCYDTVPSPSCQTGSPWTQTAMRKMAELPEKVGSVNDTDSFHPASQLLPKYYHPEILGHCSAPGPNCTVSLTSVSENIYYKDAEDSGLVPNSACEVRAKLKSRQSVMLAVGLRNVDFNASDGSSRCKAINQLAYDWALEQVDSLTLNRFRKHGVPLSMGEDVGCLENGGLWIYLPMRYKQTRDSAGREMLQLRAVQLKTDVKYKIGIFAGMHYCKLLSPARAVEWIYVDGLRAGYSLSGNRAELMSCGV